MGCSRFTPLTLLSCLRCIVSRNSPRSSTRVCAFTPSTPLKAVCTNHEQRRPWLQTKTSTTLQQACEIGESTPSKPDVNERTLKKHLSHICVTQIRHLDGARILRSRIDSGGQQEHTVRQLDIRCRVLVYLLFALRSGCTRPFVASRGKATRGRPLPTRELGTVEHFVTLLPMWPQASDPDRPSSSELTLARCNPDVSAASRLRTSRHTKRP
eukprot:824115-Prorocentrum_minimum.AAC.2